MTTPGTFLCCGVRIHGYGPEAAVEALMQSRYGLARGAHLCNSYTLALAFRDPEYRDVLNRGSLNFADGHYVAMIGRWRGQRAVTARVYGPDLMAATMDRGREVGLRHYLYGTTPQTIARLQRTVCERYPGIQIVGAEAPPFRPLSTEEETALVERVAQARPDVFWVGVGTPRQDHFVGRFADRLGCTLVAVGAAFDFNSGTKRPAPRFVQRSGMEWLYRLLAEPRRLWRRYLIGIPIFIGGVLTDLVRGSARAEPPGTSVAEPAGAATVAQQSIPVIPAQPVALTVDAPPSTSTTADGSPPSAPGPWHGSAHESPAGLPTQPELQR